MKINNHGPILHFFHFSKIRGYSYFHTWSKQKYEFDKAEILPVPIYNNLLHYRQVCGSASHIN